MLGLKLSLSRKRFPKVSLWIISVVSVLFAGTLCVSSLIAAVVNKEVTIYAALNIMSFPGAILLMICALKGYSSAETESVVDDNHLYMPLNGKVNGNVKAYDQITPFSGAGIFSKLSFWWLNPLMKKGVEKTLEDDDIPLLREEDSAEACYVRFMEEFNKKKVTLQTAQPSILWTIVSCHWKDIFVSGFFALLKILTVSAGPLFLNAFIEVAQGNESFKYEGYVLAISLFFSKSLESLSQRQRMTHSGGEIMNYVTVDAYRIGEFPFWFHQTWTTSLQLCIALVIVFHAVGYAIFAAFVVVIFTVVCNSPLAKLQHKFQSRLMAAQDERLKASSEALVNMKVLKLYAWETHFRNTIESLRKIEFKWLSDVQLRKSYNGFLFWSSPVLVSAATFGACYFLKVPLGASNVFTFVASLRFVQDPIRSIPDVIGVVIQAKVAFARIEKYLEAEELESDCVRTNGGLENSEYVISIKSANLSWEKNSAKPTLRNITLEVKSGERVAICGEVGSGKSTLLASILGEVPSTEGTIQVHGSIAYVSQNAWIQNGSIRENILFGSSMDSQRYQETLERCSLVKDLELLPYGDQTEIGERGVNLSGGQKQRIQLARALYQDTDIYLLDDPFSAVDAHTAASLFNEYVMSALAGKTVLLVTHQVDFLPAFDSVLLMSDGEIIRAAPYTDLLASSKEFQELVNAHKETAGSESLAEVSSWQKSEKPKKEIKSAYVEKLSQAPKGDQLIKQEEKEVGDTGFKPYFQYLNQNRGYVFFSMAVFGHVVFVVGQVLQNSWMAANADNPDVSTLKLIIVYLAIGFTSTLFLLCRSISTVFLGLQSSKSLFTHLLNSLFRAPMSFYDSTPLGRILSRISSDLSIVDLDVPFSLIFAVGATTNAYTNLGKYYFATAKELMRINGTTKSFVANHLAASVAGAMTIRAFRQEDRFFSKNLDLIDINASPFFLSFTASEWLIQRLETVSAIVLSSCALCMVLLPPGTFKAGYIGMALSYDFNQYMHVPSEAPEVIEENRPPQNWPTVGKVEIHDLKVRYRADTPLVLRGISCTFEGGHKIGIVGRTGSGKTTLIGSLFRLVEPAGSRIVVDGIDISKIGLHDLRSRFGIIPQDPTLFNGTVRYNLDPLGEHSEYEIWEVLQKCQLLEAVKEKEAVLDSLVMDDGSNWSMGQRQLFCLGRALLRRSRKTIRSEFADCTVITVAHRIPTVMDCTMVLAISDGKLVEFDEPMKLMKSEGSLFGQLVKEYWSHSQTMELT
ncbi:unnamed protein product [Rhodiola kirilowii]